jgi:cytochrome c peroxidase
MTPVLSLTIPPQGKQLFLALPNNSGAGCQGCHRALEFDIDPNTLNNNMIGTASNNSILDLTNTKAPSLRDLVNPNKVSNGEMMHNGSLTTLLSVINHYNQITINPINTNLDNRLRGPGPGDHQLTQTEKEALVAFLETLTGNTVYTDPKLSDPFEANGDLILIAISNTGLAERNSTNATQLFLNSAANLLNFALPANEIVQTKIFDSQGRLVLAENATGNKVQLNIEHLPNGQYILQITINN